MKAKLSKAAAAALLLFPAASRGLERTELLPAADTSLRVSGAADLRAAFDRAFGERLRADPQVMRFWSGLTNKFDARMGKERPPVVFLHLLEAHRLLKGEIATVYTLTETSPQKRRICLAARADDEEYRTFLEATARQNGRTDDAVVRLKTPFQGSELTCDVVNGGSTNQTACWMGFVENTLLLSTDREWVEQNIVRLRDETVREPESSRIALRFPLGIWIRQMLDRAGETAAEKELMLETLGLLEFNEYQLGIEVQDDDLVFDGTLRIGDMQHGLLNLLDTEPTDFSDDRAIAPNATSFSCGRIALNRLWAKLPDIIGGLPSRTGNSFMGLVLFFQQQSGLDIGNDLLAHTGSRFTFHTELAGTNQIALFSLELIDSRAFNDSLTRLLASPVAKKWSPFVEVTEYRGHPLYRPVATHPDADPAICIADGRLLLGSRASMVREAVLRMESDTRSEPGPLLRTARALAPDRAFGYGGMDHLAASLLIQFQASDHDISFGASISSKGRTSRNAQSDDDGMSLDHLASYLNDTYHYAEAVPEGIHHRLIIRTGTNKGASPCEN